VDVRNNLDGLKSILDLNGASAPKAHGVIDKSAARSGETANDSATLSTAGTEVSLAAASSDVRTGKVASIQAALAAGTYHVPASAVAGKIVDALLSSGQVSER
jgi:flagellar biosynthesis anti-sigma factor FlgM